MARVLIAEDGELVERPRTGAAPPRVTTGVVGDGCAATELGLRDEYDLMILDPGLVGCDGYEVLEVLRAARCRARVLVLTGPGKSGPCRGLPQPSSRCTARRWHRTTHHSR